MTTARPSISPSTENLLVSLRQSLFAPLSDSPIAITNHSIVLRTYSQLYQSNVAVKIIQRKSLPSHIAEKFLPRELEITGKVKHPHLARCLSILHPTPDKIVIISEYYEKGTLLEMILKQQRINELPMGIRIFRQLMEAVQYLHERNIVHRDIKLENILLDRNGDVKLADFGFSRSIQKRERSRSFCGTRPYSAPQIVNNTGYDCYASDWYAMGVVLYTMLVGKWPKDNTAGRHEISFPESLPSPACRTFIASLLDENENTRAKYIDCVYSEWMFHQPCWVFADNNFVYEAVHNFCRV